MENGSPQVRLRQAVLVAAELEPVAEALQRTLGLGDPFRDPGVGLFGLENVVFALGDCFLEIVSPTQDETAAGRYLARHGGDGGYMVIFDVEDLEGARARAQDLGVRVVWQLDLPDISGTHLHPGDMQGAIVSIDRSRPYGSWRWGGPGWTERIGRGAPGRLLGITVGVAEPAAVAARWGRVLGVPADEEASSQLRLDGATVDFVAVADEREQGLSEIALELPAELCPEPEVRELGGVRLRMLPVA